MALAGGFAGNSCGIGAAIELGEIENVGGFIGHGRAAGPTGRLHGRSQFVVNARSRRRNGLRFHLWRLRHPCRGFAGIVVGDNAANGGQNLLHRRFLRFRRLRHAHIPAWLTCRTCALTCVRFHTPPPRGSKPATTPNHITSTMQRSRRVCHDESRGQAANCGHASRRRRPVYRRGRSICRRASARRSRRRALADSALADRRSARSSRDAASIARRPPPAACRTPPPGRAGR